MKLPRFLLVGMIFCSVLTGCKPAPVSISPTPTQIHTATHTPTQTITPTPNAFSIESVFTQTQQQRLADVASSFTAGTESQAITVARALGYLPNEGHPASMCGPLAIAILQDAGLLDPAIDRHLYWKLNPRPDEDQSLLEETFSKDRYDWYSFRESLDQFDFRAFPLQPGDFIYLYAGHGGSFEHVLAVTRVDGAGRAYSVTNLNTAQGYLIQELLLYDPSRPGIGIFYDWTNHDNWQIGLTGFGGFDLWRRKIPISDPTIAEQQLADSMEEIFTVAGGNWNMLVQKIGGDTLYERLGYQSIPPGSAISVPIAMLYLTAMEHSGVTDLNSYLTSHAFDSIPMDDALHAMMQSSDRVAISQIKDWTTARINYLSQLETWGITHTSISPEISSIEELSNLFEGLYDGSLVPPTARQIILDQLKVWNSNKHLGVLHSLAGEKSRLFSTYDPIPFGLLIIGEMAILDLGDSAYLVAVFAQSRFEGDTTRAKLEAAFPQIAEIIWGFIQSKP